MKGNCSVQHFALAAQCVKKRKLRQASSLREVDLHGLMLVTMKVLNRYVFFLLYSYMLSATREKCITVQTSAKVVGIVRQNACLLAFLYKICYHSYLNSLYADKSRRRCE